MLRPTRPLEVPSATPRVHLALVAVQLFFASFGVAAKIALREVPPVGLSAIRVTCAAALFALVWALSARERVSRADLARTALYAFFGVTANQLLFVAGLARTSATNAVVLGASIPVFTVGVALALGRERATPLKLAGLGVALAGALALTGGSRFLDGGGGSRALVGNGFILLNSLSYAVYLVISRDLLQRVRPLTVITLTFAFGALGIDALMLAGGALDLIGFRPVALLAGLGALSASTGIALAYIVAFPTVGAYILNAVALRVVPASLVAIYIYVQPIVGALLAAAILGERPSHTTFIAAAAIFAGIWLVNLDARHHRPRPQPR